MKWWFAIRALLRRPPQPHPTVRRLKRLRAVYRPETGVSSRRVRDILRGEVAQEYHPHYDRLLRIERVTADLLSRDVHLAIPDLLPHIYALTERVARLIEQLQRSDQMLSLYAEGSAEQQMVADTRQQLLARIDQAMLLQESIPARLLQLSAASAGGPHFDRLREALMTLDQRLEGMVDAYADLEPSALAALAEHLEHVDNLVNAVNHNIHNSNHSMNRNTEENN